MIQYVNTNIIAAAAIAPVTVYVTAGNHDKTVARVLGGTLKVMYSKTPDIHIIANDNTRQYHKCGTTLVTMQHGDIQAKNIDAVCFTEAARVWPDHAFQRMVLIQGHFHGYSHKASSHGATLHTTSGTPTTKSKWEADHYGSVSPRVATVYYIPDDRFVEAIEFTEIPQ